METSDSRVADALEPGLSISCQYDCKDTTPLGVTEVIDSRVGFIAHQVFVRSLVSIEIHYWHSKTLEIQAGIDYLVCEWGNNPLRDRKGRWTPTSIRGCRATRLAAR